ncbi:hypothetical protein MMC19_003086 [Ptychographa xylographoides]|nr:hypothetical protein [Ptychographa xylographoides]
MFVTRSTIPTTIFLAFAFLLNLQPALTAFTQATDGQPQSPSTTVAPLLSTFANSTASTVAPYTNLTSVITPMTASASPTSNFIIPNTSVTTTASNTTPASLISSTETATGVGGVGTSTFVVINTPASTGMLSTITLGGGSTATGTAAGGLQSGSVRREKAVDWALLGVAGLAGLVMLYV